MKTEMKILPSLGVIEVKEVIKLAYSDLVPKLSYYTRG